MKSRVACVVPPIHLPDVLVQTVLDHVLPSRGRTDSENVSGFGVTNRSDRSDSGLPGSRGVRRAAAEFLQRFYSQ